MVLWIHVVVAVKVEPLAACTENTVGPDETRFQVGVVVQVQDTAARDLEGVSVMAPVTCTLPKMSVAMPCGSSSTLSRMIRGVVLMAGPPLQGLSV